MILIKFMNRNISIELRAISPVGYIGHCDAVDWERHGYEHLVMLSFANKNTLLMHVEIGSPRFALKIAEEHFPSDIKC